MKQTDEAEFREYMAACWPALVRTAYLLTGDRHHAEDLAQTTLEKAAVSWRRVQAADNVDHYVRRIMVNAHHARLRKRRVAEVVTDYLPESTSDHDGAQSLAARDEMVRALARLPRRQRAVVVLRYWEDLTETQVAGVMGCSVGTVRSQAHRALAKLRVSPELTEAAAERDNVPCIPLDEVIERPKETAA